jgi:hypothetical protein
VSYNTGKKSNSPQRAKGGNMAYRLSPRSDAYCNKDQLGFDKYVNTLHGIVEDSNFTTPFCIGIFGKWGSGKTSFMHLLEKKLLESDSTPYIIPAWFNPWRYEKEEHLIIPSFFENH